MAKRKKKVSESYSDQLADIVEKANLPDGAFDDELWDACEAEARLQHEQITKSVLLDQLEFLYFRGYSIKRLQQLVRELEEQGK